MEEQFMELARKKWIGANKENDIRKQDCLYHQTTICREFARFSEQFGERALRDFFDEIKDRVKA